MIKLLKDLDLFYPTLSPEGFWVAEKGGRIIGAVQLEEQDEFFFLGSLAVAQTEQKKGAGRALLKNALRSCRKNIYLYTIIPEFFEKFGFKIAPPIPGLPSKDRYECEYCRPDKCVTMVKFADAA